MKVITVNSDSLHKGFRLIKSIFSGDSHESYQISPFGDDSCPPKNVKGVKEKTDNYAIHVILGYFNRNIKAKAGEKRLFSVKENGDEGFYIWWKNDGSVEIGGNTDNAVGFAKLKEGFDQFKTDFNTFIVNYNTHTHTDPVSGITGVPSVTGIESTASIDSSKKDKIQTQ